MPVRQVTCETCKFWWHEPPGKDARGNTLSGMWWSGECRRRSPLASVELDYNNRERRWPEVTAADWCGEHEAVYGDRLTKSGFGDALQRAYDASHTQRVYKK